jgi:beta-glucosidase
MDVFRARWRRWLAAAATLVALGGAVAVALPASAAVTYPFQDPALSRETRIADLLSRLTQAEKISLLHQYAPAISRLGIGAFRTGTEALHGVAWLGPATVFPQALGLASTWDPDLIQQVGDAVGAEARGFHAQNPAANGLNLWAPVVNPLRDPRWGRNEEGYSEDPYLTGQIATAYGRGMMGDNPVYLQAAPTLKHYEAYNVEAHRDTVSSVVPQRILKDYDEEAFRPVIEAGAATGVMASYNLINGRPATVSPDLNDVVRGWTDEDLMNVGDAGAAANLIGSQAYYTSLAEADAAALKAGLDVFTENGTSAATTTTAITNALNQGLLTTADIDKAAGHALAIRFRLGEFDPAGSNPYDSITASVINSAAHQQLARQAATEQVTLLKNDSATLPLAPSGKVAVLGPLANTVYQDWYSGTMPYQVTPAQGIQNRLGTAGTVTSAEGVDRIALKVTSTGQYLTAPASTAGGTITASGTSAGTAQGFDVFDWGSQIVTLRSAVNNRFWTLSGSGAANTAAQPNGWYVQQQFSLRAQTDGSYLLAYVGNDTAGTPRYAVASASGSLAFSTTAAASATKFTREVVTSGTAAAAAAASAADTAVVVVGSMPMINGREDDDRTSIALPAGQQALIDAVRAANPRTVVVMETSYPMAYGGSGVPALLWTTHAGEETGNALAAVLFGDHNPSGRLTQTWYRSDADLPAMLDYDIARSGHTYQYYAGTPLFPFGYGLSYTKFSYADPRLSASTVDSTGQVTVTVDVTNTGSVAGTDVVQLYSHEQASRAAQPRRQLRAFQRVTLAAGQTAPVSITLPAKALEFWDVTRQRRVVETGDYDLLLGDSATNTPVSTVLSVHGETIPDRNLSTATPAITYDTYSGTTLVDTTKAAGTAVSATGAGQWIAFSDVALGSAAALTARVSRTGGSAATIEARLDGPTGTLLGTVTVPDTAARYTWADASAALAGATGTHDLYLVFTGPARLDTVRLNPA